MRKIETKMLDAIKNGKGMTSSNTEVRVMWSDPQPWSGTSHTASHCCVVMLHGNNIATVYTFINGDDITLFAVPNLLTLNQYPTATTKSRLRALGVSVWTQKGVTFVTVPHPTNPTTYWIAGVNERGESGVKVGAGQRAYHEALTRVERQHDRDCRKRKYQPLLNLDQGPDGVYILDELAGHGEQA